MSFGGVMTVLSTGRVGVRDEPRSVSRDDLGHEAQHPLAARVQHVRVVRVRIVGGSVGRRPEVREPDDAGVGRDERRDVLGRVSGVSISVTWGDSANPSAGRSIQRSST